MTGYARARPSGTWRDLPDTSTPETAEMFEAREDALYELKTAALYVTDFEAAGDGVADDSAAIQAAITAAAATVPGTGYGTSFMAEAQVILPPGVYNCHGLTNPGKVHIRGFGARLRANAAGPILTMSGKVPMVSGIMFDGNGVAKASNGIVCDPTARLYVIDRVRFQDFAGRGIYADYVSNGKITNAYTQNCLLDRASLADYTGAIELNGADSWLSDSEIASYTGGFAMSASGYACALVVRGNNSMIRDVIAELSDHGVYVSGPQNAANKFVNVRADLNKGHGFLIGGGIGMFDTCHAYRNGQETAFTYDGFHVASTTACNFMFSNCLAECATTSQHLVGFADDVQSSYTSKNQYVNCHSVGHGLRAYNFTNDGPRVSLPASAMIPAATAVATLSVDQVTDCQLVNVGPQTVTALSNGVNGQTVTFYGEGQTTLQNNATIKTASGANLLLAANRAYRFVRQFGIWYQL